jgi:holo-[acyl-carrier protein] synthase
VRIRVGVDVVGVERLERLVRDDEDRQRELFTQRELDYCSGKRRQYEHMAVRFAAKEAVLKAMGLGLGACGWREIEVTRAESGVPSIVLHGRARALADERGIRSWRLTMTHTHRLAEAIAVAL